MANAALADDLTLTVTAFAGPRTSIAPSVAPVDDSGRGASRRSAGECAEAVAIRGPDRSSVAPCARRACRLAAGGCLAAPTKAPARAVVEAHSSNIAAANSSILLRLRGPCACRNTDVLALNLM